MGNTEFYEPDDATLDIQVMSVLAGPIELDYSLTDGRALAADFDADGADEVVLSGALGTLSTLRVLGLDGGSGRLALEQDLDAGPAPGMTGGDLAAADLDRDGDLDLLAFGEFAPPSAVGLSELHWFENDGAGLPNARGAAPGIRRRKPHRGPAAGDRSGRDRRERGARHQCTGGGRPRE